MWCRLTITLIWSEVMHMWWALKCRTREAQRKISHSLRKSRISYKWQFLWSVQNELPQSWYEEHSSVKSDRHRCKHEAWEKWIQNPKVYFNTISSKVSTFHWKPTIKYQKFAQCKVYCSGQFQGQVEEHRSPGFFFRLRVWRVKWCILVISPLWEEQWKS